MITGKDLIEWGFEPGAMFPKMLEVAKEYEDNGYSWGYIKKQLKCTVCFQPIPKIELQSGVPITWNIEADPANAYDVENLAKLRVIMTEIVKTPNITRATVLPDACPTGSMPVGSVIESTKIHPGFHSSDVCCSMFLSSYPNTDPKELLDNLSATVHYGPGGPDKYKMPDWLVEKFTGNKYLRDLVEIGHKQLGSSGDGNHFAYVGTCGEATILITHQGSRAVGARLYKKGMKAAIKHTQAISPATQKTNSWLECDEYWDALQIVRGWTKLNHTLIHDNAQLEEPGSRFWNEHNFVFKRDGLYLHAKGATPAFSFWAEDSEVMTIIPLNMAEPILIVEGTDNPNSLGFSPHGAGRLISRTQHKKDLAGRCFDEVLKQETAGLDVRFYSGKADVTELPSAYKSAKQVREQIEKYELADVIAEIQPYGCIMGGEFDWKKK